MNALLGSSCPDLHGFSVATGAQSAQAPAVQAVQLGRVDVEPQQLAPVGHELLQKGGEEAKVLGVQHGT